MRNYLRRCVYIEFEKDILNSFYETFIKLSFLKMFKKEAYIAGRLNKALKELSEKKKIDIAKKITLSKFSKVTRP